MKRIFCGLLAFAAIACILPAKARAAFDPSGIKSEAAVLIEPKSGRVFFEKEGSKRIYPASTTKILTTIIALEAEKLDAKITCGSEVNKFNKSSSLMGIKSGETATLKDLLYGMMLASGNDAAAAVGVALGGSIEGFAKLMNDKAAELGMLNSHFMNPHGLQDEQHYSTAQDMARLAAYAMQNEEFRKVVGTKEYTAKPSKHTKEPLLLKNTNKLVHFDSEKDDHDYRYRYATGIKTGLTPTAGGCLVASASKNGVDLIAVIIGDQTKKYTGRWEEARALFEYGFDNFASVPLKDLPLSQPLTAQVTGAAADENGNAVDFVPINVTIGDQVITGLSDEINALRRDAGSIKAELHLDKELLAPVAKGQSVGTVSYRLGDEILAIVEATAGADVLAAQAPPMPTVNLFSATAAMKSDGGPNPLLYVILVALVLLLAFLVLRIIRLRNLKRAKAKRLAVHRRQGAPRPSTASQPVAGRKRSAGHRYYMYSKSRN